MEGPGRLLNDCGGGSFQGDEKPFEVGVTVVPEDAEETTVEGVRVILDVVLEVLLELAEPTLFVNRLGGGSRLGSSRLLFRDHGFMSPIGVLVVDEAVTVEGRYGGIEKG